MFQTHHPTSAVKVSHYLQGHGGAIVKINILTYESVVQVQGCQVLKFVLKKGMRRTDYEIEITLFQFMQGLASHAT